LFAGWLAREPARSKFDYTLPGVALLRVYEATGDRRLLDAALRHAEYMEGFRRTDSGAWVRYEDAAIELPPELPPDHPGFRAGGREVANGGPCVFVDSVHFDGPFFAKAYQVTGNDRFRQLAIGNILSQIELLFDETEALFHHFWMEQSRQRNGVLWGRGNGWGLLGLTTTLACLPASDPGARRILDVLRRLAERLRALQTPEGGWHTVLNDPESYVETSISAFVADGFATAIQHGWLERGRYLPVVASALDFLMQNIRTDGVLSGVSYETFPSTRREHYREMPRNAMVPWGQGPLLTALAACSKLA
jgi:unsaturated rhamnogalacturonyl hydrolase